MHISMLAPLSRFRCLLLLCLLFSTAIISTAKAQISVYGTVAVTDYGYSQTGSNDLIFGRDHVGFIAGATYNFPIQSRLTAGIDLRGALTPSDYGGGMGAASLRFGFVPHRNPFKPYIQIGGGFVTTKTSSYNTFGTPSSITIPKQSFTTGALALALGLDLRVRPSLDWRLLEIQSAAGRSGPTRTGMASFSTGIVYHFPSR